ncbi:MAG: TonB-dependent receptor [Elusimicrobiota bacterium]|jgi:outer membrane cobalamin receptor
MAAGSRRGRKTNEFRFLMLGGFLFGAIAPVWPQTNDVFEFFEYEKLSLEQTLNAKTSVTTKTSLPLRESPGILTIITRDEIRDSGARNLFDVLRLVPGIEFGVDIQGIIGIGFRGLWGQEGKVLVRVDGQEYNDLGYGGTQIDRIPVQQIERIEVIRGPGSVLYGGNAEVAVIDIHTRGAAEKGVQVAGLYGRGWKGGDDRQVDMHYGSGDTNWRLSGAAHFGQSQRSDRLYTDVTGETYPMKGNSDLISRGLNLGVEKGGFHSRFIADQFFTTQRDAFGINQADASQINSSFYLAEVGYDLQPAARWTITPRFNFNQHRPWNERDVFFLYDKTFDRYKESLLAKYEYSRQFVFLGGLEFQQDHAKVSDDTPDTGLWPGNNRKITYRNAAYYAQGQMELSSWGTLVSGGRYEHHSLYKDSLVPRVAWTKLWDRWHLKALYSEAFRTPSLENIRLNSDIRPEYLTTYELETGYCFREDLFASVAFFNTKIRRPIVYHNDPVTGSEFYSNDDPIGTHGFELTGRWKSGPNYADISYSFYSATQNRVPLYAVPGRQDVLLGWPVHKVALNGSYALGHGFSMNPSAIVLAERYGYYRQDPFGNMLLRRESTAVMINLYVRKKDVFLKGLDVGAGIFDLFGSGYNYIQPYDSSHAPLPGPSREFIVRVSCTF